jgi:hypothetical protein
MTVNTTGSATTSVYKNGAGVTILTTVVDTAKPNQMHVACPGWSDTIDVAACGLDDVANPQTCGFGTCP